MSNQLTPEMLKAIERVQKLLALAGNNPNKEEADAAAAKAQEILTAYNLDMAIMERASGGSGKREEMHERGGFYKWQVDLWSAVAELNFCKYWIQEYWVPQKERHIQEGRSSLRKQKRHRLIGRTVNTLATKLMATYLEQAIDRAVRENASITVKNQQSNFANSFRKGCADELIGKIGEKYRAKVEEEKRKEREAAATRNHPGAAPTGGTALALTDYIKSEEDANMDFIHGEGYSARMHARRAALDAEWERERLEKVEWRKANPALAAEEDAKEAQRIADWLAKEAKRSRRTSSGPRDNTDYGAYRMGRKAGESIGLDPQIGGNNTRKLT